MKKNKLFSVVSLVLLLVLFVAVAAFAADWTGRYGTKTLKRAPNTYSKYVKNVQKDLNYVMVQDTDITADGFFGDKTVRLVKKFQGECNLTKDGIVGNDTKDSLWFCAW